MKDLRLLYIEDDKGNRDDLVKILQGDKIGEYLVNINAVETFDKAFDEIVSNPYHIVILDIYEGNHIDNGKQEGLAVLKKIQEKLFIPVIFYSANTKDVRTLISQVVGVVTKGDDGIDGLKKEIERLIKSSLPFIKNRIHTYLENEFKTYFWDIIHEERDKFKVDSCDFSLGYLMLRKFGTSLSKEKISEIIGDRQLKEDKVHPMEFYLYPTDKNAEYESGEILKKNSDVYVILTPSCDFIETKGRERKVGMVLLAKTTSLMDNPTYQKYNSNNDKYKQSLIELIESRKGDRYFFLPATPFIENRIIDFQTKEMANYEDLKSFTRIAKLDSPFAQSMVSSFIRYYNRIGYPDIDSNLIISAL